MSTKQVITVKADGTIEGLQRKPGQGLDLRQFGKAVIKRASDIEWQEGDQMWAVRLLGDHALSGTLVIARSFIEMTAKGDGGTLDPGAVISGDWRVREADNALLFENYDDAVKIEITYLDALRLRGLI